MIFPSMFTASIRHLRRVHTMDCVGRKARVDARGPKHEVLAINYPAAAFGPASLACSPSAHLEKRTWMP